MKDCCQILLVLLILYMRISHIDVRFYAKNDLSNKSFHFQVSSSIDHKQNRRDVLNYTLNYSIYATIMTERSIYGGELSTYVNDRSIVLIA